MSGSRRFYITTAIDYANGRPHMGHAFEKIGADTMARYRRLRGENVHFVIGMDEHGLKVLQTASASGVTPQEWVDRIAQDFQDTWKRLLISNDDFVRTTQPRHRTAVEAIIRRLQAEDLYTAKYSGYYCVGCEAFKKEDELVRDGDVLRCPLHPTREIVWSEEENWFFRLSNYEGRLLKLLDESPDFIKPDVRRNEIRRVIEGGLEDISVSRSRLPWGIPWPDNPDQTVYVWLDALTNYLSATGFPDPDYTRIWPADVHVIGKDITRFHCIYWPAFLMSAGIDLPKGVWAHGFINYDGRKVSKSGGVTVELNDFIERHGPDAFRYYLVREIPWNSDGDFSEERFDERYTADLANNFGNLVNRTISMIERYRGGIVPPAPATSLDRTIAETIVRYRSAMDENLLHHGGGAAIELSSAANVYIEERAPWAQAKDPAQAAALDETLGALARAVAALSALFQPFMPGKMEDLRQRLGLERVPFLDEVATLDLAGNTVARGAVLFPRPE